MVFVGAFLGMPCCFQVVQQDTVIAVLEGSGWFLLVHFWAFLVVCKWFKKIRSAVLRRKWVVFVGEFLRLPCCVQVVQKDKVSAFLEGSGWFLLVHFWAFRANAVLRRISSEGRNAVVTKIV